jgi:hypothetical protein
VLNVEALCTCDQLPRVSQTHFTGSTICQATCSWDDTTREYVAYSIQALKYMSSTVHLLPLPNLEKSNPSVIPREYLTADQIQNARSLLAPPNASCVEFIHAVKSKVVPDQISPLIHPVPPMSRATL